MAVDERGKREGLKEVEVGPQVEGEVCMGWQGIWITLPALRR